MAVNQAAGSSGPALADAPTKAELIEYAAKEIAGGLPPAWLIPFIQHQVEGIATYVGIDCIVPSRTAHVDSLREIEKHAAALKRKLTPMVARRLQSAGDQPSPEIDGLPKALDVLLERIKRDIDISIASKKKGDASGIKLLSAGQIVPAISGDVYAAAVCIGLWQVVRGRKPPRYSPPLHDAIRALWHAAGAGRDEARKWPDVIAKAEAFPSVIEESAASARTVCLMFPISPDSCFLRTADS
jgi:hypothetical protein